MSRKDTPSTDDDKNKDVQIIHQASLVGNIFTMESRKVLDILKELTLVTDTETWIKGLKCGIKSIQELKEHCDGTSEGVRRKHVAISDLNKTFFKNETTLNFYKYATDSRVYLTCLINMVFQFMNRRW